MSIGRLSIIIPTYNRKDVLRKTLEAYCSQSAPEEILEIFAVDDGSTDGTDSVVAQSNEGSPIPIRYIRQEHRGAAAARNLAIRAAGGDLLLFTDDDIVPSPTLVEEHSKWHQQNPDPSAAVLGFVPWHPDVHATPFMNWLMQDGPVFCLRECAKRRELGFEFFYTCNLSLKAEFLRNNGIFDEDFESYGCEDLELGYRLTKKGLRLIYNPQAVAYHYKHMSFADACRREELGVEAHKVFRTKEAGAYLAERVARRRRSLKYRVQKLLVNLLAPALAPLKPLLDTQIPLPWPVYRALYQYYCVQKGKPAVAVNRNSEKGQGNGPLAKT
jgi:GT2 family glycosyltransferase